MAVALSHNEEVYLTFGECQEEPSIQRLSGKIGLSWRTVLAAVCFLAMVVGALALTPANLMNAPNSVSFAKKKSKDKKAVTEEVEKKPLYPPEHGASYIQTNCDTIIRKVTQESRKQFCCAYPDHCVRDYDTFCFNRPEEPICVQRGKDAAAAKKDRLKKLKEKTIAYYTKKAEEEAALKAAAAGETVDAPKKKKKKKRRLTEAAKKKAASSSDTAVAIPAKCESATLGTFKGLYHKTCEPTMGKIENHLP